MKILKFKNFVTEKKSVEEVKITKKAEKKEKKVVKLPGWTTY